MFKKVNGRRVEMTEAEAAEITAVWAAEAAKIKRQREDNAAAVAKLEAATGMTIAEIRMALRG